MRINGRETRNLRFVDPLTASGDNDEIVVDFDASSQEGLVLPGDINWAEYNGTTTTINAHDGTDLELTSLGDGTALLDLGDPQRPRVLEAGVYAVTAMMRCTSAPADFTCRGILHLDRDDRDAVAWMSGSGNGSDDLLLSASVTFYMEAGDDIRLSAVNYSAAMQDFKWDELIIQRLPNAATDEPQPIQDPRPFIDNTETDFLAFRDTGFYSGYAQLDLEQPGTVFTEFTFQVVDADGLSWDTDIQAVVEADISQDGVNWVHAGQLYTLKNDASVGNPVGKQYAYVYATGRYLRIRTFIADLMTGLVYDGPNDPILGHNLYYTAG